MSLDEFAASLVQSRPGPWRCYIAIMPADGQYDLEVEVSEGEIAGTYRTGETRRTAARRLADELETALACRQVSVFQRRVDWGAHLEKAAEEES